VCVALVDIKTPINVPEPIIFITEFRRFGEWEQPRDFLFDQARRVETRRFRGQ